MLASDAYGTWNTSNPTKQCSWKYELTGDLPALTKSEYATRAGAVSRSGTSTASKYYFDNLEVLLRERQGGTATK